MIIEIIINLYYYAAHLIINVNGTGENWLSFEYQNLFDFIFAILISCMIPVTIKLYAGIIQAKEWFESFDETEQQYDSDSLPIEKDFIAIINSEIDKRETSMVDKITDQVNQKVNEDFGRAAESFLTKIDQKIKSVGNQTNTQPIINQSSTIKPIVVEQKVPEVKQENIQKELDNELADLLEDLEN